MRFSARPRNATKERPARKPQTRATVQLTPAPEFMRGAERLPCSDAPYYFVHELTGIQAVRRNAVAALICQGCPFRQQCARWAIDNPQVKGVYGGLTDQQRAAVRKRKADLNAVA